MLHVLFKVGSDACALEARRVVEIIPYVECRPCPGMPTYVAGQFNYRGTLVPVVDLSQLMRGVPTPLRMSTRVILTTCPGAGTGEEAHLLGLLAESVTDTADMTEEAFVPPALSGNQAPYLGKIALNGRALVQRIRVEHVLTPEIASVLFAPSKAT